MPSCFRRMPLGDCKALFLLAQLVVGRSQAYFSDFCACNSLNCNTLCGLVQSLVVIMRIGCKRRSIEVAGDGRLLLSESLTG